jgi:hypothetical protein
VTATLAKVVHVIANPHHCHHVHFYKPGLNQGMMMRILVVVA